MRVEISAGNQAFHDYLGTLPPPDESVLHERLTNLHTQLATVTIPDQVIPSSTLDLPPFSNVFKIIGCKRSELGSLLLDLRTYNIMEFVRKNNSKKAFYLRESGVALVTALIWSMDHPSQIPPKQRQVEPLTYWQRVVNQARTNLGRHAIAESILDPTLPRVITS